MSPANAQINDAGRFVEAALAAATGYMPHRLSPERFAFIHPEKGAFEVSLEGPAPGAGAYCLTCRSLQCIHGCLARLIVFTERGA